MRGLVNSFRRYGYDRGTAASRAFAQARVVHSCKLDVAVREATVVHLKQIAVASHAAIVTKRLAGGGDIDTMSATAAKDRGLSR